MNPEPARRDQVRERHVPSPSTPAGRAIKRGFELLRFIAAIGSITALLLSVVTFLWALTKAWSFVHMLLSGAASADMALVQLFQSVDSILIATVMLIVGFGLWELFVGELDLPPQPHHTLLRPSQGPDGLHAAAGAPGGARHPA